MIRPVRDLVTSAAARGEFTADLGDLDRLSDGVIAAVDGWRSAAEQANGAGSGDLPRRLARLDKRVVRLFRTEG